MTFEAKRIRKSLGLLGFIAAVLVVAVLQAAPEAAAQTNNREVGTETPTGGNVPGGHLGSTSDSEIWKALRHGAQGNVSIPDKQAGTMIQSYGEDWRLFRNGPMKEIGIWALVGMVGLLALFFLIRGRIRIDAGPSGRVIERFNELERIAHWLTASTFIVLALTGLNLLYGKYVLLPALRGLDSLLGTSVGPSIFTTITIGGKYAHNFLAFGFMLGVVMMLVLWVRHNIPNRYDLIWILKLGGLFSKGVHPPSRKFNAGQKLIFWSVILGGASISVSGLALMFPFKFAFFEPTFGFTEMIGLNAVLAELGRPVPTTLTAMQEMQLSQIWHAVVGVVLIAIILAHIYIGSLGMEGAFDAMGSGYVDENWAREHHNVWVAEVKGEPLPGAGDRGHTQAAE